MLSPFSSMQSYELISYPYYSRPICSITPWERNTINFLDEVGAAAYFQITYKDKQKKKLNALNRAGIIRKYELKANRPMLIAARKEHTLPELLKSLIFAQFIIKFREHFGVVIYPGDGTIHAVISTQSKDFPVLILRGTEPTILPPLDNLIIISETFRPEFQDISKPTRIFLDNDLFADTLVTYSPDGQKEIL